MVGPALFGLLDADYWTVTLMVRTAELLKLGATAMNLSTVLVEKVMGPVYLVDDVVGVVPLVV